jgi:short-subunit dehydrogenase
MEESSEKLRPFAVITGASTGIGFELARQFAQNGYDLLIASDSEAILETQDELEVFETDVECIEVNLATYKGVEIFTETIKSYHRPIDVLIINASSTVTGNFMDTDLREEIHLVNANIISAIHLTKNLLGDMYDNGFGKILFTSCIAQPTDAHLEAVYGPSKAFIMAFAESIRHEAKSHGVTVTTLVDNYQTEVEEMFENDPADVARQGYEAVINGAESVFGENFVSKIQGWASKVLPERFKASYYRKISETFSQEKS